MKSERRNSHPQIPHPSVLARDERSRRRSGRRCCRSREQVARDGKPVAQISEIGVDAVAPSVTEGAHLLRLACDVVLRCRPSRRVSGAPLEVRVEFDAIGRVEIDALHLARAAPPVRRGSPSLTGCRPRSCGSTSAGRARRIRSSLRDRRPLKSANRSSDGRRGFLLALLRVCAAGRR